MKIGNMIASLSVLFFSATVLGADARDITVRLTVPDSAWRIAIDEVYQVKNEIWVISMVSRESNVMGAQVISTVKVSVRLAVPDLPVRHFVIGKTWEWKNEEPYTFVKNPKELKEQLKSGKLLYKSAQKKS